MTVALLTPQRPSPFGVDLVKAAAICKVGFVGFSPATKGLLNGEQVELGELLGVFVQGVGVTGQRQRGDIGVQPVNDGAGLFTRSTERLLEAQVLVSLGFPVRGKGLVEFDLQLAGGVIRHLSMDTGACACTVRPDRVKVSNAANLRKSSSSRCR